MFRISVVHYREMVLCEESTAVGLLKKEHELSAKQLNILIVKKPVHNTLIHRYIFFPCMASNFVKFHFNS